MSTILIFEAESCLVEPGTYERLQIRVEADARDVVAEMDVDDRLYQIEPSDIVEELGANKLLSAMGEKHFAEWVLANGDFYEALNAIGIERIREWIDDYCSQENGL